MPHARLKICGVLLRQGAAAEQAVDVGLQLDLQVVLVDTYLLNDKLQVLPVQVLLVQDIIKAYEKYYSRQDAARKNK